MNPLLHPEVQLFIHDHENDDERILVLKNQSILGIPSALIAQQIAGRRKIKTKVPLYYNTPNLIYPPSINIEQSSSAATAYFKSLIVSGKSAVDLTGGFGVDSYFLKSTFKEVTYVEPDKSLFEIATHNHRELGSKINSFCTTAEAFIETSSKHFDLIYIDPSRRDEAKKKVFRFSDCTPNVVELLPKLTKLANQILIKASPLLDINQGLQGLKSVVNVYIIAVENECKELLFQIDVSSKSKVRLHAVELSKTGAIQDETVFTPDEEQNATVRFSDPLEYLYEPSAAILKVGAFRLLCEKFDLHKLAPSTHLYTSDAVRKSFPGKIFRVKEFVKADSKEIKNYLPDGKANVTTRNYPLTPEQLKKKMKIRDGGELYIIGFTGKQKKFVVLADRIK